MEKRKFDRHRHEADLVCAFFNSNKYCRAKMVNYCEGGCCFETIVDYKPGASIYLRIEDFSKKASKLPLHNGFRTATLGEVKWCKEIPGLESNQYGIGVKYYQPY
jgi:hypothetical protein